MVKRVERQRTDEERRHLRPFDESELRKELPELTARAHAALKREMPPRLKQALLEAIEQFGITGRRMLVTANSRRPPECVYQACETPDVGDVVDAVVDDAGPTMRVESWNRLLETEGLRPP